jgi:IS5 family transposase
LCHFTITNQLLYEPSYTRAAAKVAVWIAGARRGATTAIKKNLARRNAVEPIIGHIQSDERLARNFLKGEAEDATNAIACGVGRHPRRVLKRLALH